MNTQDDKDQENLEDETKSDDAPVPLFNPIPAHVLGLFCILIGIEVILLGGEFGLWGGPQALGWRADLVQRFGFSDIYFERVLISGQMTLEWVMRLVSYPFVANGVREIVIGLVLVIATGKYAGDRIRFVPFVLLILLSVSLGAALFAFTFDEEQFLTGPFTMAFGLLGYYVFRQYLKARAGKITWFQVWRLPAFIIAIDFITSFLFGAPWFGVSRVYALMIGFLFSICIDYRGRISWRVLQRRLGRL